MGDVIMKCMKERLKEALAHRAKRHLPDDGRRRSAVLIPIYSRSGQYYIVFTKRTEKMRDHKGQISFPGGVYEESDVSLLNTALREAAEEIGLKLEDVEMLGELDDEAPRTTNYVISPFVAMIPWPYRFRVDAEEVDEIIEAPVNILLDKSCLREETEVIDGQTVPLLFYHCLGVVIWGATARILSQLLDILVQLTPADRMAN